MSGAGVVSRLDRAWRLLATGLAFVAMFGGGALLATTVIPLATLLTRDPVRRRRRAQAIVRGAFGTYLAVLRGLGVIRLDVVGATRLTGGGRLVIANHPTLLDVVILMALVPDARCVVKHQLWHRSLLRPIVRVAGYIPNDLPSDEIMERCAESLAAGDNLIIFPEGTRSPPGGLLPFQRGFAHIATLARADVLPVRIDCSPPTLLRGEAWYRIPERAPSFRVDVGEPVPMAPFLNGTARPLAARRVRSHLERWYAERSPWMTSNATSSG